MKHFVSRQVVLALLACALSAQTQAFTAVSDSVQLSFSPTLFSSLSSGDTVTFECSAMPLISESDVVATGGCGGNIDLSFSESVHIPIDALAAGYLSIMTCNFEGTDPCGNSSVLTVHVEVVDHTPPILQDVPDDLSLPVGRPMPTPAAVYAIDNCSRNLEVTLTEVDDSAASYERLIRTWSVSDDSGNSATASQVITIALPPTGGGCASDAFDGLERLITASDCENGTELCLPFAVASNGLMLVNNSPVNYYSCAADTFQRYDLDNLMPEAGTYEIIWDVSPGAYRYRTNSVDSLLSFMRLEQPGANWKLDRGEMALLGKPNDRYGQLQAIHASSGQTFNAAPELEAKSSQSYVVLMPGTHQLMYRQEQCVDTATVTVDCATIRERSVTVIQGIEATHSLPFSGRSDQYRVSIVEDNSAGFLKIKSLEGPNINFETLISGEVSVLVDICHVPTSSCERYLLQFEIVDREQVKPPTAARDLVVVAYNGQRMYDLLTNDEVIGEVSSLTITSTPNGTVRIDALNRLHYTAPTDWCGEDLLSYKVCNSGGCDTTTALIQVTCEELTVFNGFSPNQDGQNDNFTVIGIENYPDNQLVVFNQHGHQVYSKNSYANDWDGTFNGTPLLDGTYYYVLTINNRDTRSGFVQIQR